MMTGRSVERGVRVGRPGWLTAVASVCNELEPGLETASVVDRKRCRRICVSSAAEKENGSMFE